MLDDSKTNQGLLLVLLCCDQLFCFEVLWTFIGRLHSDSAVQCFYHYWSSPFAHLSRGHLRSVAEEALLKVNCVHLECMLQIHWD